MKIIDIVIGLGMGGVLALFHFGGLWLVLKKMPTSEHPVLLFWSTTVARYGLTLGCMYLALTMGGTVLLSACTSLYLTRLIIVPRLANRLNGNGSNSLPDGLKE